MAELKAIETIYNGYRFRSRLEARWAVVFDSLDLKWEYEPQGFELSDGTFYLPDFYLPSISTWCEVKGNMTKKDEHKISLFASELPENERLWVVRNIPDSSMREIDDFEMYFSNGGWDCPYILCECPACGKVGIEFDGRGWRVCNHSDIDYRNKTFVDVDGRKKKIIYPNCTFFSHGDKGYTGDNQRILNAYDNARQARFEHGEKPNTRNIPKPQAIDIEYNYLPFL